MVFPEMGLLPLELYSIYTHLRLIALRIIGPKWNGRLGDRAAERFEKTSLDQPVSCLQEYIISQQSDTPELSDSIVPRTE
jgi:hypothetical protein